MLRFIYRGGSRPGVPYGMIGFTVLITDCGQKLWSLQGYIIDCDQVGVENENQNIAPDSQVQGITETSLRNAYGFEEASIIIWHAGKDQQKGWR